MARRGTRIEWTGTAQQRQAMAQYGVQVRQAVIRVGNYWAAVIEAEAKRRATWQDRTSNARQALRAYVNSSAPEKFGAGQYGYPNPNDLARDTVALYLSHGMEYGIHLETKYQGRYAIIMPTLQRHYPMISKMLREIFGR